MSEIRFCCLLASIFPAIEEVRKCSYRRLLCTHVLCVAVHTTHRRDRELVLGKTTEAASLPSKAGSKPTMSLGAASKVYTPVSWIETVYISLSGA